MRLLLDESLPVDLADLILGHDVATVREMGWLGVKNGRLLVIASAEGFDVFVTPDRKLEFQQNLAKLPLAVLVLRAATNRIQELAPLVRELLRALETVEPRTLRHVGA